MFFTVVGSFCVRRKHPHFSALGLSAHCCTDRLGTTAALDLPRRDPLLRRLPVPPPAAYLRGCAEGCLAGAAVYHQCGRKRGGCYAFLRAVFLSIMLNECWCAMSTILVILDVTITVPLFFVLDTSINLMLPRNIALRCRRCWQSEMANRRETAIHIFALILIGVSEDLGRV